MRAIRFLPLVLAVLAGCGTAPRPAADVLALSATPCPPAASPTPNPKAGTVVTVAKPNVFDVAIDPQGTVYTVDSGSGVAKLDAQGNPTTLLEPDRDGNRGGPRVPEGLAIAADGTMYIRDGMDAIWIRKPGGAMTKIDAKCDSLLNAPGMAIDSHGNLYFAVCYEDYDRGAPSDSYIEKLTPDGTRTVFAGQEHAGGGFANGPAAQARFGKLSSLAFDASDTLYVADTGNLAIRRITPDGTVSTVAGKGFPSLPPSPMPGVPSTDPAPLFAGTVPVHALAVTRAGEVFYTANDNRVHRISPDGEEGVYAGDGLVCPPVHPCQEECAPEPGPDDCFKDGPLLAAEFNGPGTILAAPDGSLYVLDGVWTSNQRRLRKIER